MEILKISTCKDQKIIRAQRKVPSIISLEALQDYFEGADFAESLRKDNSF